MWLPSSVFESFFKGKEKGLLCMTFEVQTRRNWSLSMCVHAQMHPTLYPIECSLPCASVHGISQARLPGWGGLPFPSPGDLPDPEIKPASLGLGGGFFTTEPPGKLQALLRCFLKEKKMFNVKKNKHPYVLHKYEEATIYTCRHLSVYSFKKIMAP